jgi:hypothetical protein
VRQELFDLATLVSMGSVANRRIPLTALVLLIAAAIAGCGSNATQQGTAPSSWKATFDTPTYDTTPSADTMHVYRAGLICHAQNEAIYRAHNLICWDGRLTSGAKP